MIGAILGLAAGSFVISWIATFAMIRVAPRIGFVDRPGHRKIHSNPKPLGGGVAIFLGVALPLVAILLGAWVLNGGGGEYAPYFGGVRLKTRLAGGVLLAVLAVQRVGIWDDNQAVEA